jgi:ABC-type glycerol-3-phosphate transport system substrate-binding protein
MKKFGFATIIAGGMAAAVLGLAGPAQATVPANAVDVVFTGPSQGIDHLDWLNDIQQKPNVARPDTTVRSNP